MPFAGEIFGFISPEYQGMGFGSRLFRAGRRDLSDNGLKTMLVWTLSDNQRAVEFYRRHGGEQVRRASEYFGVEKLGRLASDSTRPRLESAPSRARSGRAAPAFPIDETRAHGRKVRVAFCRRP